MSGVRSPSMQSVDTDFDSDFDAVDPRPDAVTELLPRSLPSQQQEESNRQCRMEVSREREQALCEREQSVREREQSVRDRERSVREREQSVREREVAALHRETMVAEREQATHPSVTEDREDAPGKEVLPPVTHVERPELTTEEREPTTGPPQELPTVPEAFPGLSEAEDTEVASLIYQGTYGRYEKALAIFLPPSISSYDAALAFKAYVEGNSSFATVTISNILNSDTTLRNFLRALIRQVALNPLYTPSALIIIRRIWSRLKDEAPPTCGRLVFPISTILNQDFRDLQIAWARVERLYGTKEYPNFKKAIVPATNMASSFRTIIGRRDELKSSQAVYLERSSNVKDLINELCDMGVARV